MTTADKVELRIIFAAAAISYIIGGAFPAQMALGELALAASGLLLMQGLVRDLWIKYKSTRDATCTVQGDSPAATCICIESTLGVFGIVAGCFILFSNIQYYVPTPIYFWPVMVLGIGLLGFALKSLVIDWKARRIRIVRDHSSVRFTRSSK